MCTHPYTLTITHTEPQTQLRPFTVTATNADAHRYAQPQSFIVKKVTDIGGTMAAITLPTPENIYFDNQHYCEAISEVGKL